MTETFPVANPIWCAGCGHFGVLSALDGSLDRLDIPRHRALVLAGIGCSGMIQNYVEAYGYHALHGRVLPTATGAKLANPDLAVIAAGGDGDGLAIGVGHLVHTFRSNPGITYIMMNNATYGLTKGQASPTSPGGFKGSTAQRAMDPIMLGLSLPGTTFLARGYSGAPEQLERLIDAAITHAEEGNGFAFLEVISPCIAYNDTYHDWRERLHAVDDDPNYDPTDRASAFRLAVDAQAERRLATGLLFRSEERSLENALTSDPPALLDITPAAHLDEYRQVMQSFAG